MPTMAKTLVDIDQDALEQVAALLETKTKKDTVNGALYKILDDHRRVEALERMIERGRRGVYAEILDPVRKAEAWR
jgi:Arc/MetJ family transcription regulator